MITKKKIEAGKMFLTTKLLSNKELVDFWYHANKCTYSYGQVSDSRASRVQRRLVHHIDPESFVQTTVWTKIERLFYEKVGLSESYINYSESSTVTLPHCDNADNDPSILICLNQQWNRDWGGYTSFFKGMNSDTIVKTICPVPGQVIIFNGSIWHYALPIVNFAPYARFMLALKLKFMPS